MLGTDIDAAVGQLLVDSVTPLALDLAVAAQQAITARLDEADRHRQIERAQYEADAARQRYMGVDPARQRILALATDFPAVCRDPHTPHRERKRMLALLIEDVTLVKQREITAAVRFRGGATTTLTLPRPLTAQQMRVTHDDVRQHIERLLYEYTDADAARLHNERGMRTGAGDAFDSDSIKWVRYAAKIKSFEDHLLDAGMLTGEQISVQLGVNRTTAPRTGTAQGTHL